MGGNGVFWGRSPQHPNDSRGLLRLNVCQVLQALAWITSFHHLGNLIG